jgi:hypothetical protein
VLHVSSVCSKCFISFSRCMFAGVSSGCCICFHTYVSSVFRCFLQVFHTHVSECLSCFVRMLQVFHLNVSKNRSGVATSVSDACFMCFICLQTYVASVAFRRMLQVLYPNVSKVDWVLHLCPRFFAVSPSPPCLLLLLLPARLGIGHPLTLLWMLA